MESDSGRVRAQRALVSVYDKSGLIEFVRGLRELEISVVSSGGTARVLEDAGVEVERVDQVTESPEILGGRVKTLHPKIHGGILADRSAPEHLSELESLGIGPIDLVVVNLYPFEETVERGGAGEAEIIEEIDIGGPAMTRAAAKNYRWVGVVTSPGQYGWVLAELREGGLTTETRRELARKAFAHTAAYDAAILRWFSGGEPLPEDLALALERRLPLRYGENPHQRGAFYAIAGSPNIYDRLEQLSGKELSYNNIGDLDAAWSLVSAFDRPAAVVVKHANACGVAVADTIEEAYVQAHECDPQSAFGGVVALNRAMTEGVAEALARIFTEVVAAPDFDPAAVELLSEKKNLRILKIDTAPSSSAPTWRSALGGLLGQEPDLVDYGDEWKVVTDRGPARDEWEDLRFAWTVVAHTKSNAVVLAKNGVAYGIGAGDQSRVGAVERAAARAGDRASGGVCASEAFFPFRDGLDAAVAAGARAVVQPGGSVRDDEVIAAANEQGVAMVFTGRRHFRHF